MMFLETDVPKMSRNIERLQIRAKSLKYLNECICGKCRPSICNFVEKQTSIQAFFS